MNDKINEKFIFVPTLIMRKKLSKKANKTKVPLIKKYFMIKFNFIKMNKIVNY